MKKIVITGLTLFTLITTNTLASNQKPHIHGEAQLHIVTDKHHISLTLAAPAASLVGFEHPPHTADEKHQASTAKKILNHPNLFRFYAKKGLFRKPPLIPISRTNTRVTFGEEGHHSENDHHHHGQENRHPDTHYEFLLKTQYDNTNSQRTSILKTSLFEHFKGLERIVVTIVSDRQSSQYVMTPKKPIVNIR